MSNVYDYRDAGYHIFPLHGVTNGQCDCGNPECEALYKHPSLSAWQHTPIWSEEQWEVMIELGQMQSGFGVLVKNILVIDVDARNGGVDSYAKLCVDLGLDLLEASGFAVETGSGGGSMHIYFKAPVPPVALMQSHPSYKGIDFKSSGYVVGSGSMHASGNPYEAMKGYPDDLTEAPEGLIKLLERRQHFRAKNDGVYVDVSMKELSDLMDKMGDPDETRDKWIRVGMALHDTASGSQDALVLWDEWSQKGQKYKTGECVEKWHSFGKNPSLVASYGTLIHYARENGYVEPVTFDGSSFVDDSVEETKTDILNIDHIDIRKPHGFAGELCDWINNQCLYPRENLAAAAAIYILSCAGGLRHHDKVNGMTANFIAFCVAGSGSGKESIFDAIGKCFKPLGLMPATHGKFKSEQEAMRNLVRHQASFYLVDELGIELAKVKSAIKRGGASYLEGLLGFIMSAYSKAKGTLIVSGDMKVELKKEIKEELGRIKKILDAKGEANNQQLLADEERLVNDLKKADDGIEHPYLSMFGLTTGATFDSLIDEEMATNGFVARSAIFREHETNPKRKKNFKPQPMPIHIQAVLSRLFHGNDFEQRNKRVERYGDIQYIDSTPDAIEALDAVYEHFYAMAEKNKSTTGLEAIPRRGWEICSKISLILSMPAGIRTKQDVLYGFAVAKYDIEQKIKLAYANSNEDHKDRNGTALIMKIEAKLDRENPTTGGQVKQAIRNFSSDQIEEALGIMIKDGRVRADEHKAANGKTTKRYYLTN